MLRIQDIKKNIIIKSGSGGDGVTSFSKDKNRISSGGNGGNGGDVFLKCSRAFSDLRHIKSRKIAAMNGTSGENNSKTGKQGASSLIEVPCGTVATIRSKEKGFPKKQITCNDKHDMVPLLIGGKGGRGNESYSRKIKERTFLANRGLLGGEESVELVFRSRINAVVLGAENSGKSTFLNAVTSSKARVQPYPFTTRGFEQGVFDFNWKQFLLVEVSNLLVLENSNGGIGAFLEELLSFSVIIWVLDVSTEESRKKGDLFNKDLLRNSLLKEKKHMLVFNKRSPWTKEEKERESQKAKTNGFSETVYFQERRGTKTQEIQGKIAELCGRLEERKVPDFSSENKPIEESEESSLIKFLDKEIIILDGHLSRLYTGKGSSSAVSEKQAKKLIIQNKPLYNQIISTGIGPGWKIKMGEVNIEW